MYTQNEYIVHIYGVHTLIHIILHRQTDKRDGHTHKLNMYILTHGHTCTHRSTYSSTCTHRAVHTDVHRYNIHIHAYTHTYNTVYVQIFEGYKFHINLSSTKISSLKFAEFGMH